MEKITSDLKYGISNIKKGGTCNLVIKSGGRWKKKLGGKGKYFIIEEKLSQNSEYFLSFLQRENK